MSSSNLETRIVTLERCVSELPLLIDAKMKAHTPCCRQCNKHMTPVHEWSCPVCLQREFVSPELQFKKMIDAFHKGGRNDNA